MKRLGVRRQAGILVAGGLMAALLTPATGLAYYHFIHYLGGVNAPEKYDLAALPNKTVTFFVSESGPAVYSSTDTFNSVVSQLRQATAAWNSVSSSDLRVAFGGLENLQTAQNTPGGDIVFEDLPPGLYGYGGPTSLAVPVAGATGSFVPVKRSTVHLNRNLTVLPGPSYNETFFMTAVHEMGHALGLQHTFTSSTMSQATTRATTLSHPIDADDVAGISVLYPNASFARLGSIAGRVTSGGSGVHLTSVVAIRAGGAAVSALTNPDGTYRIDGVPPGQYFVYAHPLPPDADIRGPWNTAGNVVAPSGATNSLFYPGTTNLASAAPISVQASSLSDGINISLTSRPFVPLYDAGVYGYFNNYTSAPVKPAYVNMLAGDTTVVASGAGLGSGGQAPGLTVQFLGGSARIRSGGVRPYLASNGYTYVSLDLGFNLGAATGPQHLVFVSQDFMHVLPAGIIATQKFPPTVSAVTPNPDGTVTVTGTNWNGDSLIYFDGLPASITSLDPVANSAIVTPPVGASGQTAVVTVYNTDGQNSQLVQGSSPVTYAYGNSPAPAITSVSPASLPAGSEAVIDITTSGLSLTSGQVAVGFGTSDVVVRKIFVLGPNRVQVDVSITGNAALSNPDVSVISGFRTAIAPGGFQITPAIPGAPAAIPILSNALPGLNGSYPGAIVTLYGSNLISSATAAPLVSIGGQSATLLYASANQINLQIPSTLAAGPAVLVVNNGVASTYPVVVNIDAAPAAITALLNAGGVPYDTSNPAHQGDLVTLTLSTPLLAPNTIVPLSSLQVSVGGVLHDVLQVSPVTGGALQVSLLLSTNDPVGVAQTVIAYLDGRSSYPATLPIARPDGAFTPFAAAPVDPQPRLAGAASR